jgi:hypothetical protein
MLLRRARTEEENGLTTAVSLCQFNRMTNRNEKLLLISVRLQQMFFEKLHGRGIEQAFFTSAVRTASELVESIRMTLDCEL